MPETAACFGCCDAAAVPILLLLWRCCVSVVAGCSYLVWVNHLLFEADFFPKVL
jgi:hypothetical protein